MLFQFDIFFILRIVLSVLTNTNPKSLEVGELFIMEALQSGNSDFVIAVLEFWRDLSKVVNRDDSTKVRHGMMYCSITRKIKFRRILA